MANKTGKSVKRNRNSHLTGLIFWICLALIVTPMAVLGWILWSSAKDTGAPVLGTRYEGDLDPAITRTQMEEIEASVKTVGGVESVSVTMPTATLRVYADISDDAGVETAESTADEIYNKVTAVLDPGTYFTQGNGKKMYDLEIHVYNLKDNRESDEFVYVIETKTSGMESPLKQTVSEPIDAELAQSLRDAVEERKAAEEQQEQVSENTEEGGEITIGGEDIQQEEESEEGESSGENTEDGE